MRRHSFPCTLLWIGFVVTAITLSTNAEGSTRVGKPKEKKMAFSIKTGAFNEGGEIPKLYTGEGKDLSPPLEWSGAPEGTKQLAIICDDPDAPTPEPWVHWVIYRIPTDTTKLVEGIPTKETLELPPGTLQGKNSWDKIGYGGPMPPPGHGWHRYYFTLYALNAELDLKPGLTKQELLNAIGGHVIEKTQVMGKYQRQ